MKPAQRKFALCVDNSDYEVDLIVGKIYPIMPEPANSDDFIRILDESGEDYLYHRSHFLLVDYPRGKRHIL